MPPDFVSALGRLLAEGDLRAEFRRDPAGAAARLGLGGEERDALASLAPEGLERQAETLVAKRLHEASKLLPRTFESLGPEAARLFREHAGTSWPSGHDRHRADAVAFGRFLLQRRSRSVCRWEINRLRFAHEGGRWALRWVPDAPAGGRRRAALQILWRGRRGTIRSAAVWFGI